MSSLTKLGLLLLKGGDEFDTTPPPTTPAPTTPTPTTLAPTTLKPTTLAPTTAPGVAYIDSISLPAVSALLSTAQAALLSSNLLTGEGIISNTDLVDLLDSNTLTADTILTLSSKLDALSLNTLGSVSSIVNSSILSAIGSVSLTADSVMIDGGTSLSIPMNFAAVAKMKFKSVQNMFNNTLSLSAVAKLGIIERFWTRKPINANPSVDWNIWNDLGAWVFNPQPTKPHYNEGNIISNAWEDVWDTVISGRAITPQHRPWCGYWFKRWIPGPPPRTHHPHTGVTTPVSPTTSPPDEWCYGCYGGNVDSVFCVGGSPFEIGPETRCLHDPIVNAYLFSGPGSVSYVAGVAMYHPSAQPGTAVVEFITQHGYKCKIYITSTECCAGWIGYSTNSMHPGDVQNLSVISPTGGVDYQWSVNAPGIFDNGHQTATGTSVVLIVGANPDCDESFDVDLTCNGAYMDSITIDIPPCTGTIGHGVLEMPLYSNTDLWVVNSVPGCIYTWEIDPNSIFGDAAFGSSQTGIKVGTTTTGNVVTFFQATENPDCDLAPRVILYACKDTANEVELDSIDITIEPCSGGLGYSTLVMGAYETQDLWVIDDIQDCIYSWEIESGEGTLDNAIGTSNVYHSPGTNPDCMDNAVIVLKVCKDTGAEQELGRITIVLNLAAPIPNLPAYYYVTVSQTDICRYTMQAQAYKCDNSYWGAIQTCSSCSSGCPSCGMVCGIWCTNCSDSCNAGWPPANCGGRCLTIGQCFPGYKDVRTQEMKDDGCCPPVLM